MLYWQKFVVSPDIFRSGCYCLSFQVNVLVVVDNFEGSKTLLTDVDQDLRILSATFTAYEPFYEIEFNSPLG